MATSARVGARCGRVVRGAARFAARWELLLILALAPLFILPHPRVTPWLMALVPLLWLCRWVAHGRLTVRTPLDAPLLGLLLMTGVSLWATFDLLRSFSKLCGLLLGFALFYAVVNSVRSDRGLRLAAGLLLSGGAVLALASLVGTQWAPGKVPLLQPLLAAVTARLPALLRGVPRAEAGFSPNQVAGTLALFVPLAGALLLDRAQSRPRSWRWVPGVLALLAVLALATFVLLLTQSRQAYLAVAVALVFVAALQGRCGRVVTLLALLVAAAAAVAVGPERSAELLFGLRDLDRLAGDTSWAGRVEIWSRALRVLRDHPLTGIGLDTFFPVVHARYPSFYFAAGRDLTHAHNLFLQVALDLGLPGLAAFVWLLVAWIRGQWQVWQRAGSSFHRALAVGLLGGILAQLVFGVADAIALGQKPGVFTWAFLALGAALRAHRGVRDSALRHCVLVVRR